MAGSSRQGIARIFCLAATLLPLAPVPAYASNWGKLADNGCVMEYGGVRKYSAILWNISGDWEDACYSKPATINGKTFAHPHRCVNTGNMWGEWYVEDENCAYYPLEALVTQNDPPIRWGALRREDCPDDDGAPDGSYRKYTTRLWNVPAGNSWEAACQYWPLNVGGLTFDVDDPVNGYKQCENVLSTEMWGEFFVKDQSCSDNYNTTPSRGGKGLLASDSTLYGYADLHSHPFSYKGFGGGIYGSARGTVQEAFEGHTTESMHSWFTWYSKSISAMGFEDLLSLSIATWDTQVEPWDGNGTGYPLFTTNNGHAGDAWPRVWDSSHQQAHNAWIKRAHTGGLRALVALAVNSAALFGADHTDDDETRLPDISKMDVGDETISLDDWDSLKAQTAEAHRLAMETPWLELVFTPDEARETIRAGKLAMIWGSEIDHAFNCKLPTSQAQQASTAKVCDKRDIDRAAMIHDMLGIKYVFPAHLKHNGLSYVAHNSPVAFQGPGPDDGHEDCVERNGAGAHSEDDLPKMGICGIGGLSEIGVRAIKESWSLGHIVDVGHMSRIAHDETADLADKYGVPIVNGHTGLFELSAGGRRHEGNATRDMLQRVLDSGGMLGLISFQGKMDETVVYPGSPLPHTCGGTSQTWVNAYAYAKDRGFGTYVSNGDFYGNLTFSTDFNGFAQLPIGRQQEYFFSFPADQRKCWYGKDDPQIERYVQYPYPLPANLMSAWGEPPATTLSEAQLTPGIADSAADYNTRGLATAAHIPDFFEDMRVQGLELAELESVYRSALGLADMWDRLSKATEASLYWFGENLASEYPAANFPLRRVPTGHLTTIEGTDICRLWSSDHYAVGIIGASGQCLAVSPSGTLSTGDAYDTDRLSPRAGVSNGYLWINSSSQVPAGFTYFMVNYDEVSQRGIICRATSAAGIGEAAAGLLLPGNEATQGCRVAVERANGDVEHRELVSTDTYEVLVARAPIMTEALNLP